MLIIMWEGPLDQTALRKGDSWSSLQTPSCCKSKESNMSLISRLKRVAKSSSAAETQAAADGDDEAVYIHLCLKEVLFGQLDLQNWQSEARQILAALVVYCRCVYDAVARSSSSCLGLKDKNSGLEPLALKQSLAECGTMIRWCHSAAQLGDVVTKRL